MYIGILQAQLNKHLTLLVCRLPRLEFHGDARSNIALNTIQYISKDCQIPILIFKSLLESVVDLVPSF